MSEVAHCIAEFSPAAALGASGAEAQARRAIDRLLAPYAAFPLREISTLYALLDDFRDLKIASRAGVAIADDIVDRILRIEQAMLARSAAQAASQVHCAQPEIGDQQNFPSAPC